MNQHPYEYSFDIAGRCGSSKTDLHYFAWFLQQSGLRVSTAAMALRNLADGRAELDAASMGAIRGYMATVNLIGQRLDEMRRRSANVESIQQAMADMAVDVDAAWESYRILAMAFDQEVPAS